MEQDDDGENELTDEARQLLLNVKRSTSPTEAERRQLLTAVLVVAGEQSALTETSSEERKKRAKKG